MDRRDFLTGMIATGLAAKAFSALGASNPNGYVYLPSIPVLAHFVNWHTIPGGWDTAATMPVRHDNNSVHGYTSTNPEIITQQNTEMVRNGIVPLISWWGRDSYAGDKFLDTYLSVSKGDLPKIGILYESVNRDQSRMHTLPNGEVNLHDPYNANLLNSDLVHLDNKYFSRYPDRFFHVDGRPIVFLWNSHIFHGNLEEIIYPARC
ncbi:hypothetical protein JW711_00710 [Candidatus Woesearchaeota archaeon]|nr:hypothetical protein [Candidatus Woesearchaeota archaeon]